MLLEKKNLIISILEDIEIVTDLFYQDRENKGYYGLALLLTKLNSLIELLISEKEIIEKAKQEELLNIMTQAMNAMEERDTVLLSDILQYELKEQLEDMMQQLK